MKPALLRVPQFCVMRLLLCRPEKGLSTKRLPCSHALVLCKPPVPRRVALPEWRHVITRIQRQAQPHDTCKHYYYADASVRLHSALLLRSPSPSASSSARVASGLARFVGDRRWPRAGPRTEHPRLSDLNSAQARKVQAAAAHSASPRCLSSVSANRASATPVE